MSPHVAMAVKVVVAFLLVVQLVRYASPYDQASDLTTLLDNGLLGMSRSASC
jgi:hypothetical protein